MPCFITKPVPAQLAWERASLQGYQHTRDRSERPELRPQGGSHQIRALPAVPGQRRAAGEAVQLPTARSCNKTTVTSTSPRHGQHDPVACPAPRHHRDRPTAPRRASCSSTAPDGAAAGWSNRLPPTPASCDGASPRQTAATVMGARLGGVGELHDFVPRGARGVTKLALTWLSRGSGGRIGGCCCALLSLTQFLPSLHFSVS